jgi:hypothetical protein
VNRETLDILDDVAQRAGEAHCRLEEIDPADLDLIAAFVVNRASKMLADVDELVTQFYVGAIPDLPEDAPVDDQTPDRSTAGVRV